MNRNGMVALVDENGRERETYQHRLRRQGQGGRRPEGRGRDPAGRMGPVHHPHPHRCVGQGASSRTWSKEITVMEHIDEVTGLSRSVIIEPKDPELQATHPSSPTMPARSPRYRAPRTRPGTTCRWAPICSLRKGTRCSAGDVLVKIPRETTKTKDITGGLPRVVELFEARRPKECAVVTEIDGEVVLRQGHQGQAQGDRHPGARRSPRTT
ncbi:MAG: hypothetical protein MZU95_15270 [Desulfomicrobium escambiense]|nr:hypothetical protein [Desulfomicrobium escambiense]